MRSDRLTALGFGAASIACLAASTLFAGSGAAFWAAVIAAVLLALNAAAVALRIRYTGQDKTKISAVTVSKVPFEHEPRVRGKSPPPVQ